MLNDLYIEMKKVNRYHLGVVVDFFVNHEISQGDFIFSTYNIPDLIEQIYNKSSNFKLRMDIIYNIYNKLINYNKSYKNLPIISRDGILKLWDLNDLTYQYRTHLHTPFIYYNKKKIKASLEYLAKDYYIQFPITNDEYVSNDKHFKHYIIFKSSKDINWNEMIASDSGYKNCPYCGNKFNILTIKLDTYYTINKVNNNFIYNGRIFCKSCHFLDNPSNKTILNNLFLELDNTIIELWQLLCKNNIKYCTPDIINIINNTSKKINLPKYISIIMLSNISNRLDLLITLRLFKKKCSSKLNTLYKLIIDYV